MGTDVAGKVSLFPPNPLSYIPDSLTDRAARNIFLSRIIFQTPYGGWGLNQMCTDLGPLKDALSAELLTRASNTSLKFHNN